MNDVHWLPGEMSRSLLFVYLACAAPIAAAILFGAFGAIERSGWGNHYDGVDLEVVYLLLACLAGSVVSIIAGVVFCIVGLVQNASRIGVICVLALAAAADIIVVVVAVSSLL